MHTKMNNKRKLPVIPLEQSNISIEGPFPDVYGASSTLNLHKSSVSSFTVKNLSNAPVRLNAVRLAGYGKLQGFHGLVVYKSGAQASVSSRNCNFVKSCSLHPNAELAFFISCTPRQAGLHTAKILCDFSHGRVIKNVSVLVEDASKPVQGQHSKEAQKKSKQSQGIKETSTSLKSNPQKQLKRNHRQKSKGFLPAKIIIPGVPPPVPSFVNRLKKYNMPKDMKKLFEDDKTPDIFLEHLSPANYRERFAALLWAEEFQMEIDIQRYNMKGVHMKHSDGNLLALRVPDLAEKRPSIIYGDAIYVRRSGTCDKEYQGYVYRVTREEVHLRFHNEFHATFNAQTKFDVRFSFSRTGLRRAHQALEASKDLRNTFLFPGQTNLCGHGRWEPCPHAINKRLNKEQLCAVNQILHKKGAPPYIVFGPPGTGKTVTLIEAILQVRKKHLNAVVLACAPSNSAADLILLRLAEYMDGPRELLRLNSFTRFKEDIPKDVLPYCNEPQTCMGREKMMSYKVIVCTLSCSAILHAQDVPKGHFSHIFLDEAAQSTEPDTLIPIANFVKPETVVVLAGDHQQLSVVVRSEIALQFGLGTPMLERLICSPRYVAIGSARSVPSSSYRQELVTKLVRNYRSHPSIIEVPSRLFYAGELVACAREPIHSLLKWEYWPTKGFPVMFIGVDGQDEQERDSPSWWNAAEVDEVLHIIERLKSLVKPKEIGVIAPYRKQVKKIRVALAQKNIQGVKVGSVEEFQGLERRVIVVSTVRATKDNIGFVGNPKRFNVAITRAIAGLVVIGNPASLCQDPCWNEFTQYCLQNKSYIGCAIPEKEENGQC